MLNRVLGPVTTVSSHGLNTLARADAGRPGAAPAAVAGQVVLGCTSAYGGWPLEPGLRGRAGPQVHPAWRNA